MKTRAAALSVASNSLLIILKIVAGALTGSVAILTEAVNSSLDLLASLVALVSVRKADEPADEDHRYGHEKMENLAAAIEGMLILAGSAVVVYEAAQRLAAGHPVERLGIGLAVITISALANFALSAYLARVARVTDSPALAGDAAHLRTDAYTSVGVLAGLALVEVTGANWVDPVVALLVVGLIVRAGARLLRTSSRVLVDEALPAGDLGVIRDELLAFGPRGVVGYHKLRTRRAGARRYVDLHVQFAVGTTLEEAHATAHDLQNGISARLPNADVLIHLEPSDRVVPGTEITAG